MSKAPDKVPTLRELYPELNDQQLKEAEENLERYLTVVWQIFERLEAGRSGDNNFDVPW
ncbi:MAG TPA: hypothetical protein VGK99_15330 [Acidobacteriota bacterium]|jgi:hypothetical protein